GVGEIEGSRWRSYSEVVHVTLTDQQRSTDRTRESLPVPRSRGRTMSSAALVGGIGLLYVVGHDGQPLWQAVRALAVAAVTAAVMAGARRPGSRRRGGGTFGAGARAAPVGRGSAVPFAARTGFSAMTLAGFSVLLGALVLAGGDGF